MLYHLPRICLPPRSIGNPPGTELFLMSFSFVVDSDLMPLPGEELVRPLSGGVKNDNDDDLYNYCLYVNEHYHRHNPVYECMRQKNRGTKILEAIGSSTFSLGFLQMTIILCCSALSIQSRLHTSQMRARSVSLTTSVPLSPVRLKERPSSVLRFAHRTLTYLFSAPEELLQTSMNSLLTNFSIRLR